MSAQGPDRRETAASGTTSQSGTSTRFGRRWRLTGAGLCNVWRFGDLDLPALTGRLLLRGPNGTGKTTALEGLWPYLLDLNPSRLSAGKARPTSLSSLMREGASKRRCGYAWLTLAAPGNGIWSFGVRLQYSEGASPPVTVTPFAFPGRALHELPLLGGDRIPFTGEQFSASVAAAGGRVFDEERDYVSELGVRLFGTASRDDLPTLADRLRQLRNPSMLGDVSPQEAAVALRESLPGVAEDVIAATAEALAESKSTREAFARDREAAELLEDFRSVWSAHAVDVVRAAHSAADGAAREVRSLRTAAAARAEDLVTARKHAAQAKEEFTSTDAEVEKTKAELTALQNQPSYKQAGRLDDLKRTLQAQDSAAKAAADVMVEVAKAVAAQGDSLRRELRDIQEDIAICSRRATQADSGTKEDSVCVTSSDLPRPVLCAGDVFADPGADIVVHGGPDELSAAASTWRARAELLTVQADGAALALTDHAQVAALETAATEAVKKADTAAEGANAETAAATTAERSARRIATELLAALAGWIRDYASLVHSAAREGHADDEAWTSREVEALGASEPAQVLAVSDGWRDDALRRAATLAAELRARANAAKVKATELQAAADALRTEVAALRGGRLLPLPRPEWAGPGDDAIALGAALDWAPGFDDSRERGLVETALAAAGILGASLSADGVATRRWRVAATGRSVQPHLGDIVSVDPQHPLASTAVAILARIRLAEDASDESGDGTDSGLVVGRNGSFRAGVLHGRVLGADDPAQLPDATHLGARRRRDAALARATRLEEEAAELELAAGGEERKAALAESEAAAFIAAGAAFPAADRLRDGEARRVAVANRARHLQGLAVLERSRADAAAAQWKLVRGEWEERTRRRGLPTTVEQLVTLRDEGRRAADGLRDAAEPLSGKLSARLVRLLARHAKGESAARLATVESKARAGHHLANQTRTELHVLEETSGAAIAEIVVRVASARERLTELQVRLESARGASTKLDEGARKADTEASEAARRFVESQPAAERLLTALRETLGIPGVADAVVDGDLLEVGDRLLAQVKVKLEGRDTITRKTVRERYDLIRGKLAGTWALDPGDDHGDLLTYVLTCREDVYTPISAAAHASVLRDRAEQALAASDERALRDFVLGRLPSAIGTAWTKLHDWIGVVNKKMKSASASSGVGVQVRARLRDDLSPPSHVVYELSCTVADADRTTEQQQQLGEALRSLLSAAPGETMQEQVAAAVDVRDWVDVYYEVTRPGGNAQRWSSRTGLSGGERRLVVLAPMLAAIAASYDRFGEKALRLVALDEVPAEVDEQGREGLARYLAELDLDLICTSYLWDGCPGAWDGIDAHDLEAGPDGTVVAFPMLVRGLSEIPGDVHVVDGEPWSLGGDSHG